MESREELITQHYIENKDKMVERFRKLAGANDAEDIIQEAFYRALRYKESFNPERHSVGRWVGRIAINCYYNILRERRGLPSLQPYEEFELLHDPPPKSSKEDAVDEVVQKMLDKRSGDALEVCELRFLLGYHPREIAMITNKNKHTIEGYLKQFRADTREYMEKVG